MKIRRYLPAFVEANFDPEVYEFGSAEELLKIPFIERWAASPGFMRFSMQGSTGAVMAEFFGGSQWWVVGFIHEKDWDGLPAWVPPKKAT